MNERSALQEELTALARGDRAAFDPLFRRLWPLVRGFAGRGLPPAEAEDAAQEALLRVFARSGEFDPRRDALALGLAASLGCIPAGLAGFLGLAAGAIAGAAPLLALRRAAA